MLRGVLAASLLALYGCASPLAAEPPQMAPAPVVAPPVDPVAAPGPPAPGPAVDPAVGSDLFAGLDGGDLDDDVDPEEEDDALGSGPTASSPMLGLRDEELEQRYKKDPASLGSLSVGRPAAGLLVNGVQMPENPAWLRLDPGHEWGTRETVDSLSHCIEKVNQHFPGTQPIPIGHISAKGGGHLSPHLSHQAGRDVDIGYYYKPGVPKAFIRGTESNLDLPRTWLLVKTSLKETPIEMVFIDSSIQHLLADYALKNGEDPAFVDEAFQVRNKNMRAPIRHIKGHANHIHFRFHSPVAEELGRRIARVLPKPQEPSRSRKPPSAVADKGVPEPGFVFTQVKARNGDTLVVWAKRYGTTVEDIQRANGLRGNALKIGVVYKIPQKAPPAPAKHPAKPGHGAVAKRTAPKPAAHDPKAAKPPAAPTHGSSAPLP